MNLRPANFADAVLLRDWRNDTATRAASRRTHLVTAEEHAAWLQGVLGDSARQLLIAEEGGAPVGSVRCDKLADGTWELSWTIAPESRGHGLGHAMVACATARCGGRVCAWIRPGHAASEAIARAAGMSRNGTTDDDGFALWCAEKQ